MFQRSFGSLFTQNKRSKFLIYPDVDEKVSKAVEVEQVEKVGWDGKAAVCQKYDTQVADNGWDEKTNSYFDGFFVARIRSGVSKIIKNWKLLIQNIKTFTELFLMLDKIIKLKRAFEPPPSPLSSALLIDDGPDRRTPWDPTGYEH